MSRSHRLKILKDSGIVLIDCFMIFLIINIICKNARISDINNMSYINSKIVSSYTSAMHGVVNGSEYRKACNEIYRSIDKVNSQIRKLQNQISNNYSSIKKILL